MYKGRLVPIDLNIAPLIEVMWRAGIMTRARCKSENADIETGYVMFSEEIGKRYMEWARSREEHLPQGLTHHFDIRLQDDEWHPYMAVRYPLLEPDAGGRLLTLAWSFHRHELMRHRDQLVTLLRAGPQP